MRSAAGSSVALFAIAGLLSFSHLRSDPVGVYAVIDRVVLTPETSPTSIQIFGRFSMSEKVPGDKYGAAVRGYLYYKLDPAQERMARAEWGDLKSVAGAKSIVGFGQKYANGTLGRVRCASDAPTEPDVYPAGNMGVVRAQDGRNSGWPIADALLRAPVKDAPCAKGK